MSKAKVLPHESFNSLIFREISYFPKSQGIPLNFTKPQTTFKLSIKTFKVIKNNLNVMSKYVWRHRLCCYSHFCIFFLLMCDYVYQSPLLKGVWHHCTVSGWGGNHVKMPVYVCVYYRLFRGGWQWLCEVELGDVGSQITSLRLTERRKLDKPFSVQTSCWAAALVNPPH